VVELGDRISDEDPAADRRRAAEVGAVFARLPVPRHHVSGNHDLEHLDPAENEAALDAPLGSRTVALNGLRLVFWQPDTRAHRPGGFRLAAGDLAWLGRALEGDAPAVVFTHVPLSGHGQDGNYYFERNPQYAGFRDQPAIRALLGGCRAPLLAVAGHVHWNTLTVLDGVAHISLQSLTESFTTPGRPAGAWAILEIDPEIVRFRVLGADPAAYELPFPRGGPGRWTAPLPPFDRLEGERGRQRGEEKG
jgi:hypothetical protein